MFVVVMVVMVVMSSNFFGDKGLMGSNFACGTGCGGGILPDKPKLVLRHNIWRGFPQLCSVCFQLVFHLEHLFVIFLKFSLCIFEGLGLFLFCGLGFF